MTCSPARLAANRANARKSTGPKTEEGKARSRANAYKHGLTGDGVVLSHEDAAEVEARLASLAEDFRPEGEAARILVERVALLSARLRRSARQEAAALSARVEGAEVAFDDARLAEAESLLQQIHMSPATNHRRLMAMPEGVDLLIRAWEELLDVAQHPDQTRWEYEHYHRADYLHGLDAGHVATTPYHAWTHALYGRYELLRPERLEGMDDPARREHALWQIIALIEADIARLREHRATLDTRGIEAHRALAREIALLDNSPDAILARKYELAAERGLFRAFAELRELRKAARPSPAPAAPSPAPKARAPLASLFPAPPPPASAPARPGPRPANPPVLPSNDLGITVGRPAPRRE